MYTFIDETKRGVYLRGLTYVIWETVMCKACIHFGVHVYRHQVRRKVGLPYCAGDFANARGGVYFQCCNAFLPVVSGGDPFSLARAFIEDNAICMLNYILLCASSYTALRRAAETACKANQKKESGSQSTPQFLQRHAEVLADVLSGKVKAFRV